MCRYTYIYICIYIYIHIHIYIYIVQLLFLVAHGLCPICMGGSSVQNGRGRVSRLSVLRTSFPSSWSEGLGFGAYGPCQRLQARGSLRYFPDDVAELVALVSVLAAAKTVRALCVYVGTNKYKYYIMLYYIIIYYIILYCITLYYITLHYIILYYIILYYIILHYIILYYIILYYTILYYIILYYIILYYIILFYIILCYIILYMYTYACMQPHKGHMQRHAGIHVGDM